jgi:hypothetical protein
MKSKIVLWGSNAQDEKILIAIALRPEDNKVDIYTFPEEVATEDFYQQMMKEWRDGEGFELPENHTHLERELSVTESLLPDDIKVERTDLIQRAQTEWHFVVLSSKLRQMFETELAELKEKVESLNEYDKEVWGSLKEFWDKLQQQIKERNLLHEHADALRDATNELFGKMKEMRSKLDKEFEESSAKVRDTFFATIETIYERLKKGEKFQALFDELKKLQSQFHQSTFTRDDRSAVWDKLNKAFKDVKAKRFGGSSEDSSTQIQRLERRIKGLVEAIGKMERSIKRDNSDLEYERRKIESTAGQLEAQIRQAKILMIEERIRSKEEKLKDMTATLETLQTRLEKMKEREEKRKAREAAQQAAKEKIKQEAEAAKALTPEEIEKLKEAAKELSDSKEEPKKEAKEAPKEKPKEAEKDSILEAVGSTLGDSLGDLMDTASAVASVIGSKISEAIEEIKEEIEEIKEDVEEKVAKKEAERKAETAEKEEPQAKADTTEEE